MCEMPIAQVYSYATSQIHYNYQNTLLIIEKILYTNMIIKKNTNIIKKT